MQRAKGAGPHPHPNAQPQPTTTHSSQPQLTATDHTTHTHTCAVACRSCRCRTNVDVERARHTLSHSHSQSDHPASRSRGRGPPPAAGREACRRVACELEWRAFAPAWERLAWSAHPAVFSRAADKLPDDEGRRSSIAAVQTPGFAKCKVPLGFFRRGKEGRKASRDGY
eukprot:scaffold7289_cov123-Isochrysis_galbana.AAC.2